MLSNNKSKLIRLKEVIEISGLKRSTIYNYITKGIFPSQIKLGERCVAWVENEILEVNFARMAERTEQEIKDLVAQQKDLRLQNSYQ
ncbi:AlpA family transcriptional regulator [Nitrosomonas sp. Nm84]|uniref:helix-turn-helix transcriptional regulator n=1 Tax=Nitrosomonas sp. Nm84 TaxID=200124 RepID=UPI000D75ECB7|nr:AlpA family transcriptional regulator [Nitrosomonas sp. Nm84]PXW85021.1 AlpA family transcriptional regulator [Nitrosomonas sp. Nm84]